MYDYERIYEKIEANVTSAKALLKMVVKIGYLPMWLQMSGLEGLKFGFPKVSNLTRLEQIEMERRNMELEESTNNTNPSQGIDISSIQDGAIVELDEDTNSRQGQSMTNDQQESQLTVRENQDGPESTETRASVPIPIQPPVTIMQAKVDISAMNERTKNQLIQQVINPFVEMYCPRDGPAVQALIESNSIDQIVQLCYLPLKLKSLIESTHSTEVAQTEIERTTMKSIQTERNHIHVVKTPTEEQIGPKQVPEIEIHEPTPIDQMFKPTEEEIAKAAIRQPRIGPIKTSKEERSQATNQYDESLFTPSVAIMEAECEIARPLPENPTQVQIDKFKIETEMQMVKHTSETIALLPNSPFVSIIELETVSQTTVKEVTEHLENGVLSKINKLQNHEAFITGIHEVTEALTEKEIDKSSIETLEPNRKIRIELFTSFDFNQIRLIKHGSSPTAASFWEFGKDTKYSLRTVSVRSMQWVVWLKSYSTCVMEEMYGDKQFGLTFDMHDG
jgi:hypothetical protein